MGQYKYFKSAHSIDLPSCTLEKEMIETFGIDSLDSIRMKVNIK